MPLEWRLGEVERRVARIEQRLEDLPAWREQTTEHGRAIDTLQEEIRSLRVAVITAAISFAGGALLIAAGLVVAFR